MSSIEACVQTTLDLHKLVESHASFSATKQKRGIANTKTEIQVHISTFHSSCFQKYNL